MPCPPGTFSSAADDTCTECPDGEFQDGFGQTTCKSCPANLPVPSADKKTCVGVYILYVYGILESYPNSHLELTVTLCRRSV